MTQDDPMRDVEQMFYEALRTMYSYSFDSPQRTHQRNQLRTWRMRWTAALLRRQGVRIEDIRGAWQRAEQRARNEAVGVAK